MKPHTLRADTPVGEVVMSLRRFWKAYKRARAVGFPIFEALLAARSHAS